MQPMNDISFETALGERVEDTFLIQGPALQHNRAQIEIETELLDVLA